jgi:Amt family ammonium transporter
MFLLVGYNIMYVDNSAGGWLPSFGSLMGSQADDAGHSLHSDFLPGGVRRHRHLHHLGAVAERMKLWSFLLFCVVMTGFIYPVEATGARVAAS